MEYTIAHHSVAGTRPENQDRASYLERDNSLLMVVADGLGGYAGGDLAAETLVQTLIGSFRRVRSPTIKDPAAFLVLSIVFAHNRINLVSKRSGIDANLPRTTCAVCLIQRGYAYWAHVGDSRIYHFRHGRLVSRTVDHSTIDPLVREGRIDEKESLTEPGHLVRCVGGRRRPLVTLGAEIRLEEDDTLLLCTDGIWRGFTDGEMEKNIEPHDMEEWLGSLMEKCVRRFRRDCDNMTGIAVRWCEPATNATPLQALSIPELDQSALWRKAKKKRAKAQTEPKDEADNERSEIESTIAEIESFVNELDETF